jgi:hypothetical protein
MDYLYERAKHIQKLKLLTKKRGERVLVCEWPSNISVGTFLLVQIDNFVERLVKVNWYDQNWTSG